jgi:hypothetical protein
MDPETVANAFNNFFLTISESLNLHKMGKEDAISFLKDAFPVTFHNIKSIPTTETEIKSIIHALESESLTGYDEITSHILKACSALISSPSAHICNHSLYAGTFPDRLKISVAKPLYKKVTKVV